MDYIYTTSTEYTTEDNSSFLMKLLRLDAPNRYYVEVNGVRYRANSAETVTLYEWNAVDLDFMVSTFPEIINSAASKSTGLKRVFGESLGGELDFKLQLDNDTLYCADGIVYNSNEMGNYIWAYFLKANGYGGVVSGLLAQGGSIFGSQRLDEPWDVRARYAGIAYFKKQRAERIKSIITGLFE